MGLDPQAALADNDSYTFFEALDKASPLSPPPQKGGLLRTGPTGTNVNDLLFVLVE